MNTGKEQQFRTLSFLEEGGEMGVLIRQYDWTATGLGSPDSWPYSLRSTLGIMLHSAFPMFLMWGRDLVSFYNDAYIPSLGYDGKHHATLGMNAKDVWPEGWDFIGPLIEQVLKSGKTVFFEDQYIPVHRNGRLEEVYWTFSYSPVYNDDGAINGVLAVCHETTEKVLATKRLQASEQRFQALIQEATVGIIVLTGADLKVDVVNEAYCRLIGFSVEQTLGKRIFDVIPQAEPHFRKIIEQVLYTGEPIFLYDYPYEVNGKHGYLNVVYQPYKQEQDKVEGVMVLCHDITEQVRVRKKIEETQQRIHSIVESAPFPIGVYIGREMRVELVNQALIDVWGKGPNVVGRTYAEVLPELAEQDIYPQLDKVFTTGIPFHARNQRVDLVMDGELQTFYFNYSFTPLFDAEGKVYGVMNTAADVTDIFTAKEKVEISEQNLRNMILQAPVAMCILTGPEHIVQIANSMMLELWGKPVEAVMNKPIFEGLPDAREQGLEQLMEDVYVKGITFSASERPVALLRNGRYETVYQNFVYEPYRGPDGKIKGILAVTIDVTAQVLARQRIEEIVSERTQELAAVNHNLKRSNAELAQFAYIASHDLQEPLRKISTFTDMLERSLGAIDERSENYIGKIKSSSTRMLALIRDVLSYSELSTANRNYTETDLQQIIADVTTDFELLIEQKHASVTWEELPKIEAIPLQMSQLFGNLISNALKYSRANVPPVITISARQVDNPVPQQDFFPRQGIRYFQLEVRDNGIGFSQEYAGKIFNIFQRLHGKVEYEGTGIGLAMCKKIVAQHHGTITAVSEPGVGSSFLIVLPERQG